MVLGLAPWFGVAQGDSTLSGGPRPLDLCDSTPGSCSLAWVWEMAPGPAAMAVLSSIEPSDLDAAGRIELVRAWERQAAWLSAQQQTAIAAAAGAEPTTDDDWVRDELAVATRMSGRTTQNRIHVARMLTRCLPGTHAMLQSGAISHWHGLAMVELCAGLPEEFLPYVERRVLPKAPRQSVGEFRRSVRRVLLAYNPADAQEAHEQARANRDVRLVPEPDGMASVIATLPAPDARALFAVIDALARGRHHAEGGRRSGVGIGARRADALVALADAALADRALPTAHGRRVELQVVIELPTLLGMAQKPGELIGYGPVGAEVARELAGDACWRRLVTDPVTGQLLDYGRRVYTPPRRLADFLAGRDRRCRVPGCTRPADQCDIDHVKPYAQGGPTSAANTILLCRRHHRLKTLGLWKVEVKPDGSIILTTAASRRYRIPPPDQHDP
jgi:Domain of unknown function (DUF222)/HNH endonuclease